MTGLIITYMCTPYFTKKPDYILIGYAFLQVFVMLMYLLILTKAQYYVVDWLVYYAQNNVSELMITYEIIIIIGIGGYCGLSVFNRLFNGGARNIIAD